eukprot:scaffold309701_cov35-Attheya_sp.AAC.1
MLVRKKAVCRPIHHDNVGYLGGGVRIGTLVLAGTAWFVTDGAGLKRVARVGTSTRLATAVAKLVGFESLY